MIQSEEKEYKRKEEGVVVGDVSCFNAQLRCCCLAMLTASGRCLWDVICLLLQVRYKYSSLNGQLLEIDRHHCDRENA